MPALVITLITIVNYIYNYNNIRGKIEKYPKKAKK